MYIIIELEMNLSSSSLNSNLELSLNEEPLLRKRDCLRLSRIDSIQTVSMKMYRPCRSDNFGIQTPDSFSESLLHLPSMPSSHSAGECTFSFSDEQPGLRVAIAQ